MRSRRKPSRVPGTCEEAARRRVCHCQRSRGVRGAAAVRCPGSWLARWPEVRNPNPTWVVEDRVPAPVGGVGGPVQCSTSLAAPRVPRMHVWSLTALIFLLSLARTSHTASRLPGVNPFLWLADPRIRICLSGPGLI